MAGSLSWEISGTYLEACNCDPICPCRRVDGKAGGDGLNADVAYDDLPPCDVAYDPVGGEVFNACLAALRPQGTVVAVGFAGGMWEDVNPALLVGRNVSVRGFYLGRLMRHDPALVRAAAEEVLALWRERAVRAEARAQDPPHARERLFARRAQGVAASAGKPTRSATLKSRCSVPVASARRDCTIGES